MPTSKLLALPLAALALAGCPTTSFRYERLESPRRLEPKGEFVHAETGLVFPWSLEGFVRKEVVQHDVDGHDVAVHYGRVRSSGTVVISVCVYPAFEDGDSHLDGVDDAIRDGHEDVRCLQKGPGTVKLGGGEFEGWTMRHEYTDPVPFGRIRQSSRTILVRLDDRGFPSWFVMYRITCPRDGTEEADPPVAGFLAALRIR